MKLEPGSIFRDVYHIRGELGRGGMGRVYLAAHKELRRAVALKVPREDIAWAPDTKERFRREARVMARLHHENIVSVYDMLWKSDEEAFIAMEYIRGSSLISYLESLKPKASLRGVMSLLYQVARAIDYLHGENICHRDLKPSNIIIETGQPRVKLVDFGLARRAGEAEEDDQEFRTATGIAVGTPGYVAPEQTMDGASSPAVDVYALGAIIYRVLTNALPWEGKAQQLVMAQMSQPPTPASERNERLPRRLDTIFAKCFHAEPSVRPKTPGRLILEVLQALGPEALEMPYGKVLGLKVLGDGSGPSTASVERRDGDPNDATVRAALDQLFMGK